MNISSIIYSAFLGAIVFGGIALIKTIREEWVKKQSDKLIREIALSEKDEIDITNKGFNKYLGGGLYAKASEDGKFQEIYITKLKYKGEIFPAHELSLQQLKEAEKVNSIEDI